MNCPNCGTRDARQVWRNAEYCVSECRKCAQIFTAPWTRPESHGSYYADYTRFESEYRDLFEKILREIESRAVAGRLLDVGCGLGVFDNCAAQRGWQVTGIDTSSSAIALAREKFKGLDLRITDLEGVPEQFTVITLLDTLMYIETPAQFAKQADARLENKGWLVIKAIHRPKLFFRTLHFLLAPMHQRGQGLLHIPGALYHFTPRLVARLVEPAGFRLVAVKDAPALPRRVRWAGMHGARGLFVRATGDLLTTLLTRHSHFIAFFEKI